jgi:hypothetical protein
LPDAHVQPTDIAITLRRRSPWEAMDLGFTMLRQWWRAAYAAHALVFVPLVAAIIFACWITDRIWLAMLLVWWLQPLYDRVVLHVLSRTVFGEVPSWRQIWPQRSQWLGTGLFQALTFDRFDLARSFNLPVRQLEGQGGRAARERKTILGRRTRSYAVWLTVVWVHFEGILMLGAAGMAELLLPARAERGGGDEEGMFSGVFDILQSVGVESVLVYAAVILVLEPFYVAAGFALYLNRRTLLEGWDIEVALRRIAERHAVVLLALAIAMLAPGVTHAQEKNPKQEIAEVLKAKEFGYEREVERWFPRRPEEKPSERRDWSRFAYWIARTAEVLIWGAAAALIAYALWWAARMLPHGRAPRAEPYRPPAALFGMELAPEKLPPDVGAAAAALAREGKLREALGLLYRGALSELVHKRGVQLLASHTEGEAARLAGMPYFAALVEAWRLCAYARRMPSGADVERLAAEYRAAFA